MEKISLGLIALQILLILFFWRHLPPELPLFYSRPWGKEQLTAPIGLFLIPCLSFLIFLINFLLVKFISRKDEKFLSQILISATNLYSLTGFISLVQIIRLIV